MAAVLLAALVLLPSAAAKTNKVRHDKVVPPAWSATAQVGVGQITDLEVFGDAVYVAGTDGLAALDASGAIQWRTPLPSVSFRRLDVDETGVGFTTFTLQGVEAAKGFAAFALGSVGDVPTYVDAGIGALSATGGLLWQVPSDVQSPLSAPGLSPTSIAVMRGKDMIVVDRADGHLLGNADIKYVGENGKLFAGFFARGHRTQPIWWEGSFYSAFYGYVVKTDANGGSRETAIGPLFRPFYNITCDLVPFGDSLIAANTGDTQKGNTWFSVDAKLDTRFNEWTPDKQSGCGALVVTPERTVIASNFAVWAINGKGKVLWRAENKKGGLYPSSARGVRYNGGLGFRKSATDMMVVSADRIFLATDNKGDVITVLNAATGAYVHTLDVKLPIAALGQIGASVVVATGEELRFVPLAD